ncbi:MAG: general secretion pathway protein GspK, partial [Gemmataceae bacterium]
MRMNRDKRHLSKGWGGSRRGGFILITVLIVIAFLALAAYRYNDLMRSEYIASHGAQRSAETRALAESGLHYAMAALSGGQQLEVNTPQQVEVDPSANSPLKGSFQIVELEEESAKINLNSLLDQDASGDVLRQVLQKAQGLVPEMTDDVISSIIDWMDEDDDLEEQGAENEYYLALEPASRCKNGPVDSLDELLLVKGVTPTLLNGSETSAGLRSLFTVNTREVNFEPDGTTLVRLNEGDLATLESNLSSAIGEQNLTQFIMAYRLYGNTRSSGSGSSSGGTSGGGASPGASSGGGSSSGGGGAG